MTPARRPFIFATVLPPNCTPEELAAIIQDAYDQTQAALSQTVPVEPETNTELNQQLEDEE